MHGTVLSQGGMEESDLVEECGNQGAMLLLPNSSKQSNVLWCQFVPCHGNGGAPYKQVLAACLAHVAQRAPSIGRCGDESYVTELAAQCTGTGYKTVVSVQVVIGNGSCPAAVFH